MTQLDRQDFEKQVYLVLAHIPHGKVTSYGEVAKMAGFPGYARHVGKLLARLPKDSTLPWHRVLNSQGQISLKNEDMLRQKKKLCAEGIEVSESGRVRMRVYRWDL